MFELLAHPGRGGFVLVAPEDFVGVPQTGGGIVEASDEGKHASVGMLDHARLAVDEHVFAVARHDADLHPARREKIVQAAIALARKQKVEPVLGRLPARDERPRQAPPDRRGRLWRPSRRRGRGRHCRRRGSRRRSQAPRRRLRAARSENTRRCADSGTRLAAGHRERGRAPRVGTRSARLPRAYTLSSFSASASSCAAALSSGRVRAVLAAM